MLVVMIVEIRAFFAIPAIRIAARGPPTTTSFTTRQSTALASTRRNAAASSVTSSSAAIGTLTALRTAAMSFGSPGAIGCSTRSSWYWASERMMRMAWPGLQAPLASSRRSTSGPSDSLTSATLARSLSMVRSIPTLSLMQAKPAWRAARAASPASRASGSAITALTATESRMAGARREATETPCARPSASRAAVSTAQATAALASGS